MIKRMFNFNDEELGIVKDALAHFSNDLHGFCKAISQKGYLNRDGSTPTMKSVNKAINDAAEVDDLISRINDK